MVSGAASQTNNVSEVTIHKATVGVKGTRHITKLTDARVQFTDPLTADPVKLAPVGARIVRRQGRFQDRQDTQHIAFHRTPREVETNGGLAR